MYRTSPLRSTGSAAWPVAPLPATSGELDASTGRRRPQRRGGRGTSRRSRSTRPAPARCSCGSPRRASAAPTSTCCTARSVINSFPMVLGHEGAGVVETRRRRRDQRRARRPRRARALRPVRRRATRAAPASSCCATARRACRRDLRDDGRRLARACAAPTATRCTRWSASAASPRSRCCATPRS